MTPAPALLRSLELADELVARSSADAATGIVAFDRDLVCTFYGRNMERIARLPGQDVLGRRITDALPFFGGSALESACRAALEGRSSEVADRVAVDPETGRAASFHIGLRPLAELARAAPEPATDRGGGATEPGLVIGGVAVVRDDTDRLRAEQQIRETEQRFQNMADAAPVLLWMSRSDSLCTFFNQTWLDFRGRSQEQEWGVGWAEGVHAEDLQVCLDAYVDAFNARRVFEVEYRLRRADGSYRWVLDRGAPRYLPDGTFAGYIGSCVDIEDRRRAEAHLLRSLEAKVEFVGLVSHELRTPITSLELQLELIRRDPALALSPRQQELFRRMEATTSRLSDLIQSVLQFSRLERGRIEPNTESFDLVALSRSALDDVRLAADRRGLELRLEAEPVIEPLVSDPELVRLILSNLLSNAVKFTDQGSITVGLSVNDGQHRLMVRDTGRGIPAEQHERIFEAFAQLEPRRQKHTPGVGLGLALVKSLVSALGGHLSLESAPGSGSVFLVRLPSSPRP
jgi:PAS domain S-box-containing protein